MEERKNQYIDILKGISCIIVVCLHCPFPGLLGEGIIYGLRFSVPIFFMISGYFSYSKSEKWIINKAFYILRLLVFTELFYGIWEIIQECILRGNKFQTVITDNILNKNVIQIIFCGTFFNGTLWYLYAMFWTWIIIWFFRKKGWLNKAFLLIPLLLFIQILGRLYIQNNYDINKYVILFRNAFTFGLPFALLGIWMAGNQDKLLKNISSLCNWGIIISGFLLIVVEFLVVGQYMDTHISTVIISFGLFLYAIRQKGEVHKCFRILLRIGSVWYVWIYLLHIFVSGVLRELYGRFQIENSAIGKYAFPILVIIFSCLCSEVLVRFNKLSSNKRRR